MVEHSVIGTSVTRIDNLEKVTGKATYCTDLKLPGMLHAKVLRSPYPHARIISIDASKAERFPGVRAVITSKDTPTRKYGVFVVDQNVLAHDVVRYIGDPVAAVAADTADIAEEALELIEVKYEEMPAVFDLEEAWGTDPPAVVHPDLPQYKLGLFHTPQLDPDRPNVCQHHKIRYGDIEKGFQEADLIMENRFELARIHHCALEPHVCVVQVEPDGSLTLWSGRQSIHMAKKYLCSAFNMPPSKVRVIAHYIGGGFGGKITLKVEPITAILAVKTGRPVKMVFTREEAFTCGGTRLPFVTYIKDGVKKDGTLVARDMRVLANIGGYADYGPVIVRNCTFGIVGAYRIFGSAEVNWAIESHMDMIAEKLGIDAVEIRRKNLLREGDINANGEIVHSIGARECLDKVGDFIEWGEKPQAEEGPWRKGKGLAVGNKYSMAPMAAAAIVKVEVDGTIEVRHSADEMGQGCNTVLAQVAAEEFGVSMDKVKIVWGDTNITPYFPGSSSHRTTYFLGNAVKLACQDARKQILERAAEKLGASPEELDTKEGMVYIKSLSSRSIKITDIFVADRPLLPGEYGTYVAEGAEILGKAVFIQPYTPESPETGQIDPDEAQKGLRLCAFYAHAAQAIEVAVNVETGEVKILKTGAASDMGFPMNPKMCEQQMEGGLAQGVGSALWEEMIMDKGRVLNPDFRDYKIVTALDIPTGENFKGFMTPIPHKDGPYGAKGVGETQMTPSAPAIGNAVYNAVGVRIKELPITKNKVLKALRLKRAD
jgi:CO/xanthine dehydrogenase Mo-binding subunit